MILKIRNKEHNKVIKKLINNYQSYLWVFSLVLFFTVLREIIYYKIDDFAIKLSFKYLLDALIATGFTLFLISIPLLFLNFSLKKYFFWLSVPLVLSNLFNFIHLFQYKTPITMGAFAVMFETNTQEASEFLHLIKPGYLLAALLLSLLPYLFLFFIKKQKSQWKINTIFFGSFLLFSLVMAGATKTIQFKEWKYSHLSFDQAFIYNDFKRIAYYLREKRKLKTIRDIRKNIVIEASQSRFIDTIPQTYVLILGESMAKNHLGLYGYYRNTTPNLDTTKNILKFDSVIAPATQTRTAMMLILTPATIDDLDTYYKSGSIINVAKAADFKTYWISNQMMFGISDTETSVMAKDADKVIFINTDWNTNSLDERLIQPFAKALQDSFPKKLIVLHLLGSHHDYAKRYRYLETSLPSNTLKSLEHWNQHQKELVNHYDNSIIFTDYVLSQFINEMEKLQEPASMVYLSDHGQEVYDRPSLGMGHGSPILSKEVVDIPFFIWHNQQMLNNNLLYRSVPEKNKLLKYNSQHLYHSMIDLMNISTPEFKPSKSILNQTFKEDTLRILNSANQIFTYEEIPPNSIFH
jgi:heptose-I-phosphate ethanolaminephosphotransferase